ncbi:MAG TPA: patatin-like phospholipase family protein [Candidatus Omnitrophota bacterium]|nr:patatin-like phospholipase family protein [Candidatus Omnitrophota bacterium]HPS37081.1 patatin-like phospholipase family protein [Candidatus Omnitrophota bacterium]
MPPCKGTAPLADNHSMASFFPFGRKIKPESKEGHLLDPIPLFTSLIPEEQALIERHSRLVGFKRGDIVYEEGASADAFYIIISGRFRLFTRDRVSNEETTLLYFYRGEHFGETSLLTGNVHSASVEAKTDATALRIGTDDFHKLLNQIPALGLHLSRSLGRHLTREELGYRHHRREVRIAGFYGSATEGMARFLFDFIAALKRETQRKVLLLDLSGALRLRLPDDFRRGSVHGFDLERMDPSSEESIRQAILVSESQFDFLHVAVNAGLSEKDKKFTALLTYLTYEYDYLVICLPEKNTLVAVKALNYSDRIYLWADKRSEVFSLASTKVAELCQNFGFSRNEIWILMPSDEGGSASGAEPAPEIQLFSMLPSLQSQRYRYEKTLTFLAKEWSERLVGLVLGSGAAYGLAHIGVLRVLEEENIPVDVIAGSSIGALIGALWAAGYDSHAIENIAKSLDKRTTFFKILGLRDISALHRGFFKGEQIVRFLSQYLKNTTFQDLRIPVKMTATDLLTSEEVVLDSGSVVNALRSTISIPGFFRPVPYKGSYLIDGGIVDPLPVKILSGMGVRKIIAVNVLPGPKDLVERNELRRKSYHESFQRQGRWRQMVTKTLDRLQRRYTANIFNVLMNSIMFTEFEIARMAGNEADIFIHAAAADAHWIEFFSQDKFVDEGVKKTRDQMVEIRRLLAE